MRPRAAEGGVLIAFANAPTRGTAGAAAPDPVSAGRTKPRGKPQFGQSQPFLQLQWELEQ